MEYVISGLAGGLISYLLIRRTHRLELKSTKKQFKAPRKGKI